MPGRDETARPRAPTDAPQADPTGGTPATGGDLGCAEPPLSEHLLRRVDTLGLSVRAQNCLYSAGAVYVYQVAALTEPEMLRLKGYGRKALDEIEAKLGELGLSHGMVLGDFPGDAPR